MTRTFHEKENCIFSLYNSGVLSPLLLSLIDIKLLRDNLSAFTLYVKKSLPSNLKHFVVFPRYFLAGNLERHVSAGR